MVPYEVARTNGTNMVIIFSSAAFFMTAGYSVTSDHPKVTGEAPQREREEENGAKTTNQ